MTGVSSRYSPRGLPIHDQLIRRRVRIQLGRPVRMTSLPLTWEPVRLEGCSPTWTPTSGWAHRLSVMKELSTQMCPDTASPTRLSQTGGPCDDGLMSEVPLRVMLVDDHEVVRDGIKL